LILSIFVIALLGLFVPGDAPHSTITPWPDRLIDFPNSMGKVAGQLDLAYFWHHLNTCVPIILAILFGDLFSAVATLLAVGRLAKLTDEHGNLPKLGKALLADSTAAMGAAFLGTNTPIIYIESAAGAEQGGRTGLVSIVVAACYLLALFLTPIIAVIPPVATTPALVIIGIFAAQGLADVDLRDLIVAATAVVTILIMALGSSADGVAIGFIVCVLMSVLTGKARTLKPAAYVLLGIFLLHYMVL
jgi:AGZA family xanthine/uracil permease-like MFS transporter